MWRSVVAVIVAFTVSWAPPASASAEGPEGNRYGVISAINGFSLASAPRSLWNLQLGAMHADGVQVVRSDAAWGVIEPKPPGPGGPVFQFASTDQWVEALADHDLTWQPILDYNNSWGTAVDDTPQFAAFAQAVAARYGLAGTFWAQHPWLPYRPVQVFELWNEENGSQWHISAQDYGPLYAAVHHAIHAVDPQAEVDVGGLGEMGPFNPGTDYASWYIVLLFSYDPALEGHVDGFALHPYGPTATDSAWWTIEFRQVLGHYGEASAPIDITELGWPYSAATEAWRAAQMNALGLAFSRSNCGIREVAPYDWINPAALNESGDFGFVDRTATNTTLRPAAAAWFKALAQGSSMAPFAVCHAPPSSTTRTLIQRMGKRPAPANAQAHRPRRARRRHRRRT
jgi:hypothetical protein